MTGSTTRWRFEEQRFASIDLRGNCALCEKQKNFPSHNSLLLFRGYICKYIRTCISAIRIAQVAVKDNTVLPVAKLRNLLHAVYRAVLGNRAETCKQPDRRHVSHRTRATGLAGLVASVRTECPVNE